MSRGEARRLLLSPGPVLGRLLHVSEPQLPPLGNGILVLPTQNAARANEASG